MRFQLIDQVTDRQADGLSGVKCVTQAEEYLADHFPGFAVLPGVLMLESLVQAARAWLDRDAAAEPVVLAEAKNVRYGNMVRPGESLKVQVKLRKQTDQGWEFDGTGSVNDEVAVQARFRLEAVSCQLSAFTDQPLADC